MNPIRFREILKEIAKTVPWVPKDVIEKAIPAPTFRIGYKSFDALVTVPDEQLFEDLWEESGGRGFSLRAPYQSFRIWNPRMDTKSVFDMTHDEFGNSIETWLVVDTYKPGVIRYLRLDAGEESIVVSYVACMATDFRFDIPETDFKSTINRTTFAFEFMGACVLGKHGNQNALRGVEFIEAKERRDYPPYDMRSIQKVRMPESTDQTYKDFIKTLKWTLKGILDLCYSVAYPEHQIVKCMPEGHEKKSVEWTEPRSYYVILSHETITHMQAGKTRKEIEGELTRAAHKRRGHIRRLMSDRFKNTKGQTRWIKDMWVGPKEWMNREDNRVYKIVD